MFYTLDILICILILIWVLKLWMVNMNIPFLYVGDSLFTGMLIKGMIEHGWYLHNISVGMPYGLKMYDYPSADSLHYILIKIISLFHPSYAWAVNVYYLATFPLTAISALFVFRKFNISYPSSIVGSLLYTFLPYHFMRGENHLFLASYYMIPLIVMVILWIYLDDDPLFFKYIQGGKNLKLYLSPKAWVCIIICLITASAGVYYAFFACIFLLVIGISACISHNDAHRLVAACILIAIISFGVIGNMAPNLLYEYQNGKNMLVAQRYPLETETYGLKISQLLLPISGHRVPLLSRLKNIYNMQAPLVNENDTASLGVIGSLGFLLLLGWPFYRLSSKSIPYNQKISDMVNSLSILNLSALLYGTIGGFGVLFSLIVSSEIRALNRISVYIAFFSIISLFSFLEFLYIKYCRSIRWKSLYILILGIILIVGVLDQTNNSFILSYKNTENEYLNDEHFVNEIESSVPKGAMIFQLPYVPFPENPPVYKMTDYDLFKGYLHSNTLKWSYGTMKGRDGDLWQQKVTALPTDKMLEELSFAGFSGIYLDSYGYSDMGINMEANLSKILNTQPIVSDNKRLLFFNMLNYNKTLKNNFTDEQWISKKDEVLYPLFLTWSGGFSSLEGTEANNWRWCSSNGELIIDNPSANTKIIDLQMLFKTGYSNYSNLIINSTLLQNKIRINSMGSSFIKNIMIPPGAHIIKFYCDAPRVYAPNDSRYLVFSVNNFKINNEGNLIVLQWT